ncbi:CLUMA_CG006151, isoform A [Clunio marinus]|uniref:CLUMA_CG006151, isoform A n=1 Tax=Clunio marinus TaxID=568069 RepID=A0A1J1I173_9DIPT|nr:CLUMA_CG006151, isoform A [Clunio marinus]
MLDFTLKCCKYYEHARHIRAIYKIDRMVMRANGDQRKHLRLKGRHATHLLNYVLINNSGPFIRIVLLLDIRWNVPSFECEAEAAPAAS